MVSTFMSLFLKLDFCNFEIQIPHITFNGILLPWQKKKQKWNNRENGKPRNKREVLAVVSSDYGRCIAIGRKDARVKIFDATLIDRSCNEKVLVHAFEDYKEVITSLALRNQTPQLFLGSDDGTVRQVYSMLHIIYSRCARYCNLE